MPLLNVTVEHGRTLPEARERLEQVARETQAQFGTFLQRVEWADDRNSVKMFGPGVEVQIRVDDRQVQVIGDAPWIGKLLGSPLIKSLQGIVENKFQKRLK